ncbi:MAG: large conductance mechanosensitive channel protein MscL [Fimbriimonadia bacterium]
MLKEFREFALKGSMLDLAIGLILGTAFGAVVASLVTDVLMPPIGVLLGGVDLSNMFVVLKEGSPEGPYPSLDAAAKAGAATLNYGVFINVVINFVIVSFAVFMLVKSFNKLRRQQPAPEPAAEPPADVALLTEIRDILKTGR